MSERSVLVAAIKEQVDMKKANSDKWLPHNQKWLDYLVEKLNKMEERK